jgi:hypothetical protein
LDMYSKQQMVTFDGQYTGRLVDCRHGSSRQPPSPPPPITTSSSSRQGAHTAAGEGGSRSPGQTCRRYRAAVALASSSHPAVCWHILVLAAGMAAQLPRLRCAPAAVDSAARPAQWLPLEAEKDIGFGSRRGLMQQAGLCSHRHTAIQAAGDTDSHSSLP